MIHVKVAHGRNQIYFMECIILSNRVSDAFDDLAICLNSFDSFSVRLFSALSSYWLRIENKKMKTKIFEGRCFFVIRDINDINDNFHAIKIYKPRT